MTVQGLIKYCTKHSLVFKNKNFLRLYVSQSLKKLKTNNTSKCLAYVFCRTSEILQLSLTSSICIFFGIVA